jgi:hypothetical protein
MVVDNKIVIESRGALISHYVRVEWTVNCEKTRRPIIFFVTLLKYKM